MVQSYQTTYHDLLCAYVALSHASQYTYISGIYRVELDLDMKGDKQTIRAVHVYYKQYILNSLGYELGFEHWLIEYPVRKKYTSEQLIMMNRIGDHKTLLKSLSEYVVCFEEPSKVTFLNGPASELCEEDNGDVMSCDDCPICDDCGFTPYISPGDDDCSNYQEDIMFDSFESCLKDTLAVDFRLLFDASQMKTLDHWSVVSDDMKQDAIENILSKSEYNRPL